MHQTNPRQEIYRLLNQRLAQAPKTCAQAKNSILQRKVDRGKRSNRDQIHRRRALCQLSSHVQARQ